MNLKGATSRSCGTILQFTLNIKITLRREYSHSDGMNEAIIGFYLLHTLSVSTLDTADVDSCVPCLSVFVNDACELRRPENKDIQQS